MANGEYFWNLCCVDTFSGPQYSNFTTGNFTVEEKNFTVSLEYPPIFLDSEDIEFNVETPHNSDYSGKLIYPNGETKILSTNQDKIDSSWLTQVGEYTLNLSNNYFENETFRTMKFDVIKANIISYYSEIEKNELAKIKFSFDSNSPGKEITDILANFKDGNKKDIETNKEITHNYTSSGNYKIEVSFKFAGSPFSVLSENIEVTNPEEDNEAPSLNLIYPKNNEIIKEDTITFKYEVGDDGTIKQCEYQLFKKTDDTGIYEDEYVTTDKSIELNTEQQIKLTSFEDGDYRWDINCEDNYGEEVLKKQYFTVKTTKHEYEDEIDEALDNLDSFLEKEESYSMDTKEFLDKIGISEDLTYYKKRLLQIDQDLGTNIKFITNENLKKERTEETIEELNEIEKNIPKEINIIDSSEFIKNSLIDLEEITKEYVEGKNILLSSREIKKLAEKNKGIQENLGTTTKIKIAEIKYVDSIEKITLVTKKIDLISEEYETIIEKIPNTIENIEFQTESKEINKNLFEIKIKDIENKEISYVIREETSIDKLKESETILFEEFPIEGFSFTGYSIIGDIGETSPSHWILIVIATLVILYFSKEFLKKNNLKKWKKEENVRTILEYSSKAKKFLQENNTENAKECYHKIKEIYNLTPEKFRNHIFPVIKNIQIGINKREIQEFVKEYENAKRERRENDAKILYRNIQENYKKLPKIYQEKIYERIIKKNENFSL